eukprot:TRINITY_DN23626_c0_g1_i3.p1 TRINITY_DN23626_c0_g1~~TRINITY_DN23626_c0_g1_i3.p1  ORF type:complete len:166 (-),score=6.27 TRINITY_DN23626_c0_g1_i3:1018-1515(-)
MNYYEQWPDFGCEGIKVQRAHQPTSQCQGKKNFFPKQNIQDFILIQYFKINKYLLFTTIPFVEEYFCYIGKKFDEILTKKMMSKFRHIFQPFQVQKEKFTYMYTQNLIQFSIQQLHVTNFIIIDISQYKKYVKKYCFNILWKSKQNGIKQSLSNHFEFQMHKFEF